jgi:hypothetical protein
MLLLLHAGSSARQVTSSAQMCDGRFMPTVCLGQCLSFELLFDRLALQSQARTGANDSAPARKLCVV